VARRRGLVFYRWRWEAALASLPLSVLCGYVALRSLEELYDMRGWFKAVLLLVRRRKLFLRLLIERRALQDELSRAWKLTRGLTRCYHPTLMTNRRLLLLSNGSELVGRTRPSSRTTRSKTSSARRCGACSSCPSPRSSVRRTITARVRKNFGPLGYEAESLHDGVGRARGRRERGRHRGRRRQHLPPPARALRAGVVELIRERVAGGMPYVGWSAGSNVACPTIRTTNDMPIVEPPTLRRAGPRPLPDKPALHGLPPARPHGRDARRAPREFVHANPGVRVIGIREGTMLRVEGDEIRLLGGKPARSSKRARSRATSRPKSPSASSSTSFSETADGRHDDETVSGTLQARTRARHGARRPHGRRHRLLFGYQTRYDLREGFPIVTTKRVPFRWIAEELFWFLSGDTNEANLRARGVDIWKEWADLEHTSASGARRATSAPSTATSGALSAADTPRATALTR
jgi:hypothetical protein